MALRDVVVLGASGRLGGALCTASDTARLHRPARERVMSWLDREAALRWFDSLTVPAEIHVALGVIDPKASEALLEEVNVTLPTRVLEVAQAQGHRVFTYGTVMEGILSAGQRNPYIQSKVRLADRVRAARAEGVEAVHCRLHTLYGGGPPPPFMFSGLMLRALRDRTPFAMTQGRQFREYHHVDDEAKLIVQAKPDAPVVEVSHGAPIRLCDLATHVFEAFGAKDLLRLGALPDPASDYYDEKLDSAVPIVSGACRPTLSGVVAWFADLGVPWFAAPQESQP